MEPKWTLILVLILAALLFLRPGKLSSLMEDFGKGIRGFRKGMSDPNQQPPAQEPPKQVADQNGQTTTTTPNQDRVQS